MRIETMARTGAQAMLEAARDAGVGVCFANPGTTEMPLVEALDRVDGIRPILGLFEGVCTGAADGYGRMLGRPALTLLHLGPGFANGIANLHNARRARSPIVNIVGDHASWHLPYDAPLTSDIVSLARPVSGSVITVAAAQAIEADMREAVGATRGAGGSVSTLIVPVDYQQAHVAPASNPVPRADSGRAAQVPADRIAALARQLRGGARAVLLLGGNTLGERGQRAAARLAQGIGAVLYSETYPASAERGGGLPELDRLPYFPEAAIAALGQAERVILAGALEPVAYFGYAGLPSLLARPGSVELLSLPHEDGPAALEMLADELGCAAGPDRAKPAVATGIPDGALTPPVIGRIVAGLLPDGAIVSVEGGTCGYPFFTASGASRRHTVLTNTGGAIGQGLPCAFGAAIACPERRVIALQSDGSAQYTLQVLWSMAREGTPVTVLIASNRRYAILQNELARAGVAQPGPRAQRLTELDDPPFDWIALAKGYGVPASRVEDGRALQSALQAALREAGPVLIEMML